MDSREFVAALVEEMEALFARLGDRQTLEAEAAGEPEVVPLLEVALTSELEAAEIAGGWLPTTPEIDAKMLLAEQCAEEMSHYRLISRRLEELGVDLSGFDPLAGGYSPLFEYLRGLRSTVERIAAGPFANEAIAEVRNLQFIDFCRAVGDEETARLYEERIHPDESRHHELGRRFLEEHATTPERQEQVTAAVRSTLAIADELRTLTEKNLGMRPIPSS